MAIDKLSDVKVPKDAWYAIYTKHQHEKSAADLLARKGFETLLPLYRLIRRWKDRDKSVLSPLFPCYVFVRTDLARKVDILRTPGVFWLVESGGCACQIPEADVEEINKIVQSPARIAPHPYLKSGEWVRVRHGSLKGLEGILARFKNQYRVVVTVEPLRKSVAVEVDISAIEPLPGADPKTLHSAFSLTSPPEMPKRAPLSRAAAAGASPSWHSEQSAGAARR
jgi:transcription antitermination factor NusG